MKKKWSPARERYFHGGKGPLGVEYHHYPSLYAQDHWLYVVILGRSRTPVGFHYRHEGEPTFLLHYIRRGEFCHSMHRQRLEVSTGQVCLMDLREPVEYHNEGLSPVDNWWVCFGGKDVPDLFSKLGTFENPVFAGFDAGRFERWFCELLALTRRKPPAYEMKASGLLTLLLAELAATRDSDWNLDIDLVPLPRRTKLLSVPVRDSIRYIARFYGLSLNLKALSGVSGLSLHHYAHQFHRETGLSPMQYLTRYRIETAKRVLQTSRHPVQEVARMVGIPNQFNFSRLFRKIAGVTPSRYRGQAVPATGEPDRVRPSKRSPVLDGDGRG